MTLLSLVIALLIERLSVVQQMQRYGRRRLRQLLQSVRLAFTSGYAEHARLAWWVVVIGAMLLVQLTAWLLQAVHPFLFWLFNAVGLAICLRFHAQLQLFEHIDRLLTLNKLSVMTRFLRMHLHQLFGELQSRQIYSLLLEQLLINSHRYVFAVVCWFCLFSMAGLSGVTGAVFYLLVSQLYLQWQSSDPETDPDEQEALYCFNDYASRYFYRVDWLPAQLMVISLAVSGHFEQALRCWRQQSRLWPHKAEGALLAAGAGALHVTLGGRVSESLDRPDIGTGEPVDHIALLSARAIIWRCVIMMLLVALFLTMAGLL